MPSSQSMHLQAVDTDCVGTHCVCNNKAGPYYSVATTYLFAVDL